MEGLQEASQFALENKGLVGAALAASFGSGYVSAIAIPPVEIAVKGFRMALKFPPFAAAVRKHPAEVKKMLAEIKAALEAEVDANDGDPSTAPAASPKVAP